MTYIVLLQENVLSISSIDSTRMKKEHAIFEGTVALGESYFEKNKKEEMRVRICRKNSSILNI